MVVRADALVVAILVRNHSVRNFERVLRLPWLSSLASQTEQQEGLQLSRRVLVPAVVYIAPAAAVSRGAGSSTDHGLGVDPGPSSTVAVFVTIRNDMSVDERSLVYAHGGVFVVNARLLSRIS